MSGPFTRHCVKAQDAHARELAKQDIIDLVAVGPKGVARQSIFLTIPEARGLSVRLAEAIAKATIPQFAHLPHRCPSNHWNDGNDVCADCGESLQ